MRARDYLVELSELGKVYIPGRGLELDDDIEILYERKPWLESFRVSGIRPAMSLRKGPGSRTPEEMIILSYEIYSGRLEKGMTPREYVAEMTGHFIRYIHESEGQAIGAIKRVRSAEFLGWVENLWREGDPWCEQLVKDEILPMLYRDELCWARLKSVITNEFNEWIRML